MSTNFTCAISGAFLMAGGWGGVMWVFLRSLALHLQICWQVVIGRSFMWGALATGWGIPAIALIFGMIFSGVSFRFGDTCHINHKNSLADFWIPLLVFSGATVIIQFVTFGYCIKVYLASLADSSNTTEISGVLPSYTKSLRTVSPRQAYRRVRRVIELQWRGIAIVLMIVTDVVFFAIVFVFMDDLETNIIKDPTKAEQWLTCLVRTAGDKVTCLPLAQDLVVNEATVGAVLVLLSVSVLPFASTFLNANDFSSPTVSGQPCSWEEKQCSQAGLRCIEAKSSPTTNSSVSMHTLSRILEHTKCSVKTETNRTAR